MTPREFGQEWNNEPHDIPREDRFYKLAMEYHRRAEAFDQSVCTRRRGPIAIPETGEQLKLVNRNARELIDEIAKRERGGNSFVAELKHWIIRTGHEFEQQLRRATKTHWLDREAELDSWKSGSQPLPKF